MTTKFDEAKVIAQAILQNSNDRPSLAALTIEIMKVTQLERIADHLENGLEDIQVSVQGIGDLREMLKDAIGDMAEAIASLQGK